MTNKTFAREETHAADQHPRGQNAPVPTWRGCGTGEEIVIAEAGKPVARLIGLSSARQPRPRGLLKGRIHIAADFDAPLPADVLADLGGDEYCVC
jgi:hypothetical protein